MTFKKGDRVRLISKPSDSNTLLPGAEGTVIRDYIEQVGRIRVAWDNWSDGWPVNGTPNGWSVWLDKVELITETPAVQSVYRTDMDGFSTCDSDWYRDEKPLYLLWD